jgi:tRNA dimethylallyltransferase
VSPPGDPKLLILVGPTAVGKTEVALRVARQLAAEIVSADSRLVYRFMDIDRKSTRLNSSH